MSLVRYIARRLIFLIPILFGTLTLTFILSRLMPGDPVLGYVANLGQLERGISPEDYERALRLLGLDKPILEQYAIYLKDLFTGNWGYSISVVRGVPVWDLIGQRIPRTVDLAVFSMLIAIPLGIKTGIISAKHRNKAKDTFVRGFSLLGVSIPVFFLGLIFQYVFGYILKLFPITGYKNYSYSDPARVTGFRIIDALISGEFYIISDYLYHLILPVLVLTFHMLGNITRQTRSSMLEILEEDYIRTARVKGCDEKNVLYTHARKNALIPTVAVVGLNLGGLFTGAVLTEVTFNFIGVGDLLTASIALSDYWVLNGIVFFITISYVLINLVTDVIYGMLDPRISY
ncbi:MAG: ABC transporter permease [Candidatus Heimdallarchaeota archaeon]